MPLVNASKAISIALKELLVVAIVFACFKNIKRSIP